jgi:rhamnogalacturonan endolyase
MSVLRTASSALVLALTLAVGAASAQAANPPRQTEFLDRGAVAVPAIDGKGVLVSWRKLYDDADGLAFNLYRDGKKLNAKPIMTANDFLDASGSAASVYEVRGVAKGKETSLQKGVKVWADGYLSIPLNKPADGKTPDGKTYSYTANDASIGDLDGDGRYEIILKWDPTNSHDNSQGGYTGNVFIDAYTLDGKQLWRIDLGRNIRAGAHYTQFQVFDYDGDGKAEIVMKTADGTVDGTGKVIGDPNANWVEGDGTIENTDRTGSIRTPDGKLLAQLQGRILKGPEYLTVFEGSTGKAVDTVPYLPGRTPETQNPTPDQLKATWGDSYANRSERYLAGTAYLDGVHPSVVMARGYYGRTVLAAFDYKDGKLTSRWVFDSTAPGVPDGFSGQGNHQLSVADADGDGKDEIIYGSMAVDDNGQPLWTAKMFHGDAMHVSDLDPSHPGLEKFGVHEEMRNNGYKGSALISLSDGKVLWTTPAQNDTGRGLAADIDPRFAGAETWNSSSKGLYNIKGVVVADVHPRQTNFTTFWDSDTGSELLDGNKIFKWNWKTNQSDVLMECTGCQSNNGTKSTPALSGDILGDWREELVERTADNTALHIYSTNIPTEVGMTTLVQDSQYRVALAWQNTAYNQPPHTSFFMGYGMAMPPKPNLVTVRAR